MDVLGVTWLGVVGVTGMLNVQHGAYELGVVDVNLPAVCMATAGVVMDVVMMHHAPTWGSLARGSLAAVDDDRAGRSVDGVAK